jgi:hypothetical protein
MADNKLVYAGHSERDDVRPSERQPETKEFADPGPVEPES